MVVVGLLFRFGWPESGCSGAGCSLLRIEVGVAVAAGTGGCSIAVAVVGDTAAAVVVVGKKRKPAVDAAAGGAGRRDRHLYPV